MRTAYNCRTYPDIERPAQLAFGRVRLACDKTIERREIRSVFRMRVGSLFPANARAHRKIRQARQDFLRRTSTNPVRRADAFAIDDLNDRSGMTGKAESTVTRPRRAVRAKVGLNRCVLDAAFGEFRPQLERLQLEYSVEGGGQCLVVAARWYFSSTTCSSPGHLLNHLKLSVQAWTCPHCRIRHERDVNATTNILAAGRVVAGHNPGEACGAGVSPQGPSLRRSATKQEESGVSPVGIPAAPGGA